jgi:hypothetical protein
LTLFIDLVLEFRLLGAAAEIEIRDKSPLAGKIDVTTNRSNEGGLRLLKILRFARLVGQSDPKEDGRVAAPVVLERVPPFLDAGHNDMRELIELLDVITRRSISMRSTQGAETGPERLICGTLEASNLL